MFKRWRRTFVSTVKITDEITDLAIGTVGAYKITDEITDLAIGTVGA